MRIIISLLHSRFKCRKGFSLIEVLVGTFLVLIVFLGIFGAYQLGLQVVGQSKNKVIATYLANAELEKIRNLPYGSVGVQGSFPSGILAPESEITQNNITFKTKRRVDYVVDSADGLTFPGDECPNDYKKVEIQVSVLGKFAAEVLMLTDIVPKNLAQECGESGGILSVTVFDALGVMVPLPLIEIKDPNTDTTLKSVSPSGGQHYFALAASSYKVVVSKSGYSSERTYGTNEVVSPLNPHPIVLENQLTEISFSIDRLSSFSVDTVSRVDAKIFPVANVTFNLRGEKIIGYNAGGSPVYKYSENHTTNSQGHSNISGLEWDNYKFSIVSPLSLSLVETIPAPQPISLVPNTSLEVDLFLSPENALLVTVQDSITSAKIFSAAVRLYNLGLGYDVTQYTDENGQTYFVPLQAAEYTLQVSAVGYSGSITQVSVFGNTTKTIQLGPGEIQIGNNL
ncbi:MAG: prepilin-type N-terminal cleavage/methylation domain-containing protein [Patescibacteria group bacterium]